MPSTGVWCAGVSHVGISHTVVSHACALSKNCIVVALHMLAWALAKNLWCQHCMPKLASHMLQARVSSNTQTLASHKLSAVYSALSNSAQSTQHVCTLLWQGQHAWQDRLCAVSHHQAGCLNVAIKWCHQVCVTRTVNHQQQRPRCHQPTSNNRGSGTAALYLVKASVSALPICNRLS